MRIDGGKEFEFHRSYASFVVQMIEGKLNAPIQTLTIVVVPIRAERRGWHRCGGTGYRHGKISSRWFRHTQVTPGKPPHRCHWRPNSDGSRSK